MTHSLRTTTIAFLAVLASACGGVHTTMLTQPVDIVGFKQVGLAPIQVTSTEQNPDALALNDQLRRSALNELQGLFISKSIDTSGIPQGTVECTINVTYGNRALRYFVGFGAGSGHMHIALTLKDSKGTVRYATASDADLAIGAFGGNMSDVAEKTIHAAVQDFGSRW